MHKAGVSLRPCRQRRMCFGQTFADEIAMYDGYENTRRCPIGFCTVCHQLLLLRRLLNAISESMPKLKEFILTTKTGAPFFMVPNPQLLHM